MSCRVSHSDDKFDSKEYGTNDCLVVLREAHANHAKAFTR
jgi:hypothetical protein